MWPTMYAGVALNLLRPLMTLATASRKSCKGHTGDEALQLAEVDAQQHCDMVSGCEPHEKCTICAADTPFR